MTRHAASAAPRVARSAGPRPVRRSESVLWRTRAVSLRQQIGKGERAEGKEIEEGVHRHRDENRAAPFIGQGETAAENKERPEAWQVHVHRGKEERIQDQPGPAAEVTFQNAV